MESKQFSKYQSKAKDSFKTKMDIFIFSLAITEKVTFTVNEFNSFNITKEIVKLYSTQYWQQPRNSMINNLSVDDIYKKIKCIRKENEQILGKLRVEYVNSFSEIFKEEDFITLVSARECHYCKISLEEIHSLVQKGRLFSKNERGRTLEIDRINSNYEYVAKNCVMACYWCNNAKTDEFTLDEFELIGEVIGAIWKKRLV